jgi:cysteine sulfinate desulfinase/cysteine desulfurase-like protein
VLRLEFLPVRAVHAVILGRAIEKAIPKARAQISKKLEVKPTLIRLVNSDTQNTIIMTIMAMNRK